VDDTPLKGRELRGRRRGARIVGGRRDKGAADERAEQVDIATVHVHPGRPRRGRPGAQAFQEGEEDAEADDLEPSRRDGRRAEIRSGIRREGGRGHSRIGQVDVVSIQFAIHYMMSTRKRARRFFNTVSSLLEVGGNLIATTIDARVVVEKLMGLGLDYHFDELDQHVDVDKLENEERHRRGNKQRKVENSEATVSVGRGVCRLKFDADTLRKVFQPPKSPEDMFGLQYTFTLVESSDHAASNYVYLG